MVSNACTTASLLLTSFTTSGLLGKHCHCALIPSLASHVSSSAMSLMLLYGIHSSGFISKPCMQRQKVIPCPLLQKNSRQKPKGLWVWDATFRFASVPSLLWYLLCQRQVCCVHEPPIVRNVGCTEIQVLSMGTDLPFDAKFPLLPPPALINNGLHHIELVIVCPVQVLVKHQISRLVRHAAHAQNT